MAIGFNKMTGGAKSSGVKYMKWENGNNVFRILPDSILPTYQYWVKGANGKNVPFDALQFDRDNEVFDNSRSCPVRDLKLKDEKGEDLRCKWAYRCLALNKATGQVEVVALKKGILTEIQTVAQDLEFDPTDPDTGSWLTVERKKEPGGGPFGISYTLRQLKVKQEPLTDEEKKVIEDANTDIEAMFPVESYEAQRKRLERHINGDTEAKAAESNADTADKEAISELSD
jgi:hypothetical protein